VLSQRDSRYRQLVDRFEQAVRADVGRFAGIAELCRKTGIKRRTLLRAFQSIRGTTPSRYLRAVRLDLARQAFLVPAPGCKSVTEIATRFGFRELGRFSVEYRATFGESPSETIRRAAPNFRCSAMPPTPAAGSAD
jgi:transcriptional regulator GlxA family with amidase domain